MSHVYSSLWNYRKLCIIILTLSGASEKCPYPRSVLITEVSLYVYRYRKNGLCSGHGHSVLIREMSLYPQSLLAKLTVLPLCSVLRLEVSLSLSGAYAARLQEWFPCQLMHQHSTQLKCCFSYPTEFLHILLRLGEIDIHKLLDDDVIVTHL